MKVYNADIADRNGLRGSRIKKFIHIDAYRLKDEKGLVEIGIGDYLGERDSVVVIEWAERVKKLFRGKKILKIKLELGKKEDERKIILKK
jgi:tRNA A37 threonylcarbamoyladenosine biosynthesis protein TsaE